MEEPELLGHRRPPADQPHQRQRRGQTRLLSSLCSPLTFPLLLLTRAPRNICFLSSQPGNGHEESDAHPVPRRRRRRYGTALVAPLWPRRPPPTSGDTELTRRAVCRPLQGAHSTSGADNEYNLRSRTVICDSCGQTSERGGGCGLPEGLGGHSFFMGTNEPRMVGAAAPTHHGSTAPGSTAHGHGASDAC